MPSVVLPGRGGVIDVPISRSRVSVRELRRSARLPKRYAVVRRARDGSIKELDDDDYIRDDQVVQLVPRHEEG